MSTSFPLKYPLSARNSRGNRCRERAADAAECRCFLAAAAAAAAARETWNCDGPPSCPFDQTYLTQIEYTSRDIPCLPLVLAAAASTSSASPIPPYFAHKTSSDTETATSWDFTSRRCDTALSNSRGSHPPLAPRYTMSRYFCIVSPSLHPTFRIISLASSTIKCTPVLFRPRGSRFWSKFFRARRHCRCCINLSQILHIKSNDRYKINR